MIITEDDLKKGKAIKFIPLTPAIRMLTNNSPALFGGQWIVTWEYENIPSDAEVVLEYYNPQTETWERPGTEPVPITDLSLTQDQGVLQGTYDFRLLVVDTEISSTFEMTSYVEGAHIWLTTLTTPLDKTENITLNWNYQNIVTSDVTVKVQKCANPLFMSGVTDETSYVPITDKTISWENILNSGTYYFRLSISGLATPCDNSLAFVSNG
jgi:hypothetical protein